MVSGDTGRVQAILNYAPDVQFGTGGFQQRIDQNLSASGQITFIPDHLFLSLHGFAATQSTSGGYGPGSTVSLDKQNQTQSSSFSATPYLRQHFGDVGSAELGASLSHTSMQSQENGPSLFPANSAANQISTTQQEYLSFTSGPQFGRYRAVALVSAQQSEGTGVMDGASRQTVSLDNGFAVTRDVTVLGKFGYETIRYGGIPPFRFNGPLWNTGVRWVPNPDSSIEIRYGYHEGTYSPLVNASYAPTARIRVFVHYAEALTTDVENLQNAVNASVLDPLGNPVDPQTGAPLLLASNFYGVQNNLARVRLGSLTGTLLLDRDSVSLSISRQNRQQLAAASVAAAVASAGNTSSTGTYGSINWQHDLGQALTTVAFMQYGVNDSFSRIGTQSSDTLVVSLGLHYALSETLSGTLQYSYTSQFVVSPAAASPPISLALLSVRKTF